MGLTVENKIFLSVFEDEVNAIIEQRHKPSSNEIMIHAKRILEMSVQEIIRHYGVERIGEDLYQEYLQEKTKGVIDLKIMKDSKMIDKLEALFATPFDGAERDYDLNKTIEILYQIEKAYDTNQQILIIDRDIWGECHDIILSAIDDKGKDSKYVELEDFSDKLGKWVYVSRKYFDEMYAKEKEIDYTNFNILQIFTHVGMIASSLHTEKRIDDYNIEDVTGITKKFLVDFFMYNQIRMIQENDNFDYGEHAYGHEYLDEFYYDKIVKSF
jgi:hypothetical protein